MLKRLFDIILSLFLCVIFLGVIFIIIFMIKISSRGPVFYWSTRVGKNNITFKMPKFRTMQVGSPEVASDLLYDAGQYLTSFGSFLRKSSLDELPQLWSVLIGDMSFVGPRPALFNQEDLISLRTKNGVYKLLPGITGWAQVNGRDELSVYEKVQYEIEYVQYQSFWFDIMILIKTIFKVILRVGVSH